MTLTEAERELVEAVLAWDASPKFLYLEGDLEGMKCDPRVRAYAAVWQRLERAMVAVRAQRGSAVSDEERDS